MTQRAIQAQASAATQSNRRPGTEGARHTRRHTPRERPGRAWPRKARRGLANVLLTVAIVAIVLVFLIGIYTTVNSSIRTQAVQTTLTSLEAEIRRSFANAPQYTAEAYHDFLAPRMPRNAQRGAEGAEDIVTPWGGAITAGGGNRPGAAAASPNRFWILVADLPREACISIAESFLNRASIVRVQAGAENALRAVSERAGIERACDGGDDDAVGIVFRG